uniref:Protein LLP homolog n=1 Tax=Parascaris univalens TaxID=6257 RepID=A0A915BBE8_PARUN
MAKSIRSKFKRKMRAIKRKRLEPREFKRLEATVRNLKRETIAEAVMETEERKKEAEESMDMNTASGINLRTMKKADGSFPIWLSQRKVKQAKKKQKILLKARKK